MIDSMTDSIMERRKGVKAIRNHVFLKSRAERCELISRVKEICFIKGLED
jgi:hypothetical protein